MELSIKKEEYWVMRIVAPVGASALVTYASQLKNGALVIVNGDIVEPLSEHADSEDALVAAQSVTARTGEPCKVVLNADL